MKTIRVLVVDDHPVVREGLAAIFSSEPDLIVVGEAETGEEAIHETARLSPSVVVVDIRLPGMTGIDVCQSLSARYPGLRLVVLTSFPSEATMLAALSAGARAFVVKDSKPAILRQAVRSVAEGETFIDPRVAGKLVALATKGRRAKGPFGLSLQEMRVLEFLPRGATNREIGRDLGLSEHTIKTHLSNAMAKIGAKNRADAAVIARGEGLA